MASQPGPGTEDVGHGGEGATLRAAAVTGTFLALAAVVVLYLLVAVWPPAPAPQVAVATPTTATTAPGAPAAAPPTTIAVVGPPTRRCGCSAGGCGWSARRACSWWSPWPGRSAA
jgi:hypothetical protein